MPANLKIKIGCSQEELVEALKLRYQVFYREIKGEEPTASDNGIDRDEFDEFCEHLIVVDNDKDAVIGTYRMLLDSAARKGIGFYSSTKFDLTNFGRLEGGRMLEVGRSCVHKDYRHGYVLNLLWEGVAKYSMANQVRYIFGSSSLMTLDQDAVNRNFAMFKALGLFVDMGIDPVDEAHRVPVDETVTVENPRELYDLLPTIFKGYMQIGLKVCGYPAKGDFNTALFPVLLDLKQVHKIYRRRFLGNYLLEEETATPSQPH